MQVTVDITLLALSWLFLLVMHPVILQAQEGILMAPGNITAGLGLAPLNLTCQTRREQTFVVIDGIFTSRDDDSRGIKLLDSTHQTNGTTTISTLRLQMELIEENNNTVLYCFGGDIDTEENDIRSPDTSITIFGPPLSPSALPDINESAIQVSWEEPYSAEEFPITSYYLRVVNQTNETVLVDTTLSPGNKTFTITRMDTTSCTELIIEVRAENAVGNSSSNILNASFSSGPQGMPNITSVTFSPATLDIDFVFPTLCPYNNATYMIEIEDEEHRVVHTVGPNHQSWMSSGSLISTQLSDVGLELNAQYTLTISVATSVGHTSSVSSFSTFIPTTSSSDGFILVKVAAGSIGGSVIVIIILIAIIMCIIYIARRNRKRKQECFHTTEIANGSTHIGGRNNNLDSRGMPMVDNPIYESDPIYDEINPNLLNYTEEGYMSLTSPATDSSSNLTRMCSLEKGNDEYTRMNPIGTLLGQLSVSGGGAAAIGASSEGICFSNNAVEEGASAQLGQQQQDLEGRYTIQPFN